MKKGIFIFAYIMTVLAFSACAQKMIVNDCKSVEGDEGLFVCTRKFNP